MEPDIQIVDVDLRGDRQLKLQHTMRNGVPLAKKSRDEVLKHLARLWGYKVSLSGVDSESETTSYEVAAKPA